MWRSAYASCYTSDMRKGGSKMADAGFTIVEVLIVLAVTGLMFVSAALLINGRQNKTMFMSAVNDFRQQLQQIINQTQSGYYGGTTINCQSSSTGPNLTVTSSDGSCIFLGSVLQFTTGSGTFKIVPVIGNRLYNGQEVSNLSQAYPTAATDAAQTDTLEYGLTVASASPTNSLAVISSLASYGTCGGASVCLNSGSQSFGLYDGSNLSNLSSAASAYICVNSGTTSQSAKLTISGEGVTSQVANAPGCPGL